MHQKARDMDVTAYTLKQRDAVLSVGNYGVYHQKLTVTLAKLRKRVGLVTTNYKKESRQVTADDVAKDHRYLHITLLEAERAWAHGMHLYSTVADEASTDGVGAVRKHALSRLRKAYKHAQLATSILSEQATSRATDVDVVESLAYTNLLLGCLEFEKQSGLRKKNDQQLSKQRWKACLAPLSTARLAYDVLHRATKADVFKEAITSHIDASLLYAAYQMGIPRKTSAAEIAKRFIPTEDTKTIAIIESLEQDAFADSKPAEDVSGGSAVAGSINWRGRVVNLSDASITQALVNVEAAEARLKRSVAASAREKSEQLKGAAYDEILTACQDAVDTVRQGIDGLERDGTDEGDKRMQELRICHLALSYNLITWRVGRNRTLIGELDGADFEPRFIKPQRNRRPKDGEGSTPRRPPIPERRGKKLARLRERVALYDAIMQSIESVKELKGAARDATFLNELDAKRSYFRALKCVNLSRVRSLCADSEGALHFLQKAHEILGQVVETPLDSRSDDSVVLSLVLLTCEPIALQKKVGHLLIFYRALVDMHTSLKKEQDKDRRVQKYKYPLAERLDEFDIGGVDLHNIIQWPPKLRPIPMKPIFIDIAWNYVQKYNEAATGGKGKKQEKSKESADDADATQEAPKKRGWGFFYK